MKSKKILAYLISAGLIMSFLASCSGPPPVSNTPPDDNSSIADTPSTGDKPATVGKVGVGYYDYANFSKENGELTFTDAPVLKDKGLPPVAERLPKSPVVYQPVTNDGKYGGEITFSSINIDQDWTLRNMNTGLLFHLNPDPGVDGSNSPLEKQALPGIFESWKYDPDGKWFEFVIRDGIKWSDGIPVTSEDIRFFVEDVLLNKEIYPATAAWLTWKGGETKVSFPDDRTYRVDFEEAYGGYMIKELRVPNSYFGRIMVPAHYMKQFHKDYAKEEDILADMKQYGFYSMDEWGKYYSQKKAAIYGTDYIGMPNKKPYPTLDQWMVTKDLGNGNYEYERNPYFHIVDTQGQQLPYIDKIKRTYVADAEVLNMDIISGKLDIASSGLTIEDYPLYSDNKEKGKYEVLALPAYQDHDLVYSFNFEVEDPAKRKIFNDIRFRQAVSMSLDRTTMNETMYLGLGTPSQLCPRPTSKYFKEGMDTAFSEYDVEKAKALLDDMGMKDVNNDGFREDLDGKQFIINMDWFVVSGSSQSGVEYLKRYLEAIGVKINLKQIDPSYFWEQIHPNNEQEMTVWWLGGAGADTLGGEFSAFLISTPNWWNWANYTYNNIPKDKWTKKVTEPPQWGKDAFEAFYNIRTTADPDKIAEYAEKLWTVEKENLHTLGVAHSIKTPFVIKSDIGNVTEFEKIGVPCTTVLDQSHSWYKK